MNTENTAKKLVVLGSANVDISAWTPRFPKDGESVVGNTVRIGMGGKGTNQATAAARCGARVVMLARLGCDFFASIPEQHYQDEGIDARFVTKDTEAGTGCALIEVHAETGENRITVVPGANHKIPDEVLYAAEDEIASADLLLTQMETNPSSIALFLALAKKHNKPVVLNPAPAMPIPEDWYPMIDTITPNETEACTYTGVDVENDDAAKRAADIFHEKGVRRVVITCGSRGVFLADYTGEKPMYITVPTNRVRAVDTTGAGDAFNGAFCVALAEGRTIIDACRFACCAATISVTRPGAAPSMASRAEADAVYNAYYHSGKKIDARARMLAAANHLFWRAIEGTGEDGLVTEQDVRNCLKQKEE